METAKKFVGLDERGLYRGGKKYTRDKFQKARVFSRAVDAARGYCQEKLEAVPVRVIRESDFERLKERLDWLECLEAAGVDNWPGMEDAIRLHNNEDDPQ
jgi:hypothetical protein